MELELPGPLESIIGTLIVPADYPYKRLMPETEADKMERARADARLELARYNNLPRDGHERMKEYLRHMAKFDRMVKAMLAYDLPSH